MIHPWSFLLHGSEFQQEPEAMDLFAHRSKEAAALCFSNLKSSRVPVPAGCSSLCLLKACWRELLSGVKVMRSAFLQPCCLLRDHRQLLQLCSLPLEPNNQTPSVPRAGRQCCEHTWPQGLYRSFSFLDAVPAFRLFPLMCFCALPFFFRSTRTHPGAFQLLFALL